MDMSRAGLGGRARWTLRKRSTSRHKFVIIAFAICHEFITSGIVRVHFLVLDLGKTRDTFVQCPRPGSERHAF